MNNMSSPVTANEDGIKLKPELMEKEKMYHCFFQKKMIVVFKDDQDLLNCYEIEEEEIIEKIKTISNQDDIEKIFEDYIKQKNLKH